MKSLGRVQYREGLEVREYHIVKSNDKGDGILFYPPSQMYYASYKNSKVVFVIDATFTDEETTIEIRHEPKNVIHPMSMN